MAAIVLTTLVSAGAAERVQLPGGPNWSFDEDIVAGEDPSLRDQEVTVQDGIDHARFYPLDVDWDWKKPFRARTSSGEVTFYLAPADGYNAFLADNRLILFPSFRGRYPTTVYIAYIAVNWWGSDGHRWLHPYRWTDVYVMTEWYEGMLRVKLADWCLRGVTGSCDPGRGSGKGYVWLSDPEDPYDCSPVEWENVPAEPGFPARASADGVQRIDWNVWVLRISSPWDGIVGIRIHVPSGNPPGGPPHVWVVAVVAEYPDGGRSTPLRGRGARLDNTKLDGTYSLPDVKAVMTPWVSPHFGSDVRSLTPFVDTLPYSLRTDYGRKLVCTDDHGRLWLSLGGELIPFDFEFRGFSVGCATEDTVVLPKPARAVYLLYVATCWWDERGNPVDQYPILVRYTDKTVSGLSVRIVDWCALDPRAYDEGRRRVAARACPDPQPYWVNGEPLVFQTPTLIFGDRGDGKYPIAWLLKIQAPPDKRITELDFPERWWRKGGLLWILAITELAEDGRYYSVFPEEDLLWDPYRKGSCPYTPHSDLDICTRLGMPFALRYYIDKAPAPTPDMLWEAYVRGVLPPDDGVTTDFGSVLHGTQWYTEGVSKATEGLKLALSALTALYDSAVKRQAGNLGLKAYRAYPAVIQGVVWSSDSSQLLIYQPTLGVSFYGPPVLVRALNSYASALLAAAEDLVLRIALGRPQLAPWQRGDAQLREEFVRKVNEELGLNEATVRDFTEAIDRGKEDFESFLKRIGIVKVDAEVETALSTLLARVCGLSTEATVYTYYSMATGEILPLVITPRALPSKGGVTTGSFCSTLTDNLRKAEPGFTASDDLLSTFKYYFNNPLINGAMATLLSWGIEWAIILSAGLIAGPFPAAAELLVSGAPYIAAFGSSAAMALLDRWLNGRTWDQVLEETAVGAAAGTAVYRSVGRYISKIPEYAGTAASKVIARYYDFSFNWSTNSILAATSNLWLIGG